MLSKKICSCCLFICVLIFSSTFVSCKREVEVDLGEDKKNIAEKDTTPPDVVSNVSVTVGNNSVLIEWMNPIDNDFEKVRIRYTPTVNNIPQPIYLKGEAGKKAQLCIDNLKNDIEYTFYLAAVDTNNNTSDEIIVKTIPRAPVDTTPPAVITDLTATPGDKSVLLSWKNPSDEDFVKVEVTFEPEDQDITQPIYLKGDAGEISSICIENLENNIEYTFYITGIDSNNNKSETVSIESTPKEPVDETPPEPVTYLTATPGDRSVLLSWTNPTDEDFQMVKILFTPVSESVLQPIYIQGEAGKTSSVCIENLRNNVEYTFSCISIDKNNNQSQAVSIKSIPKDDTPPEDVTNLIATAKHKRVILSWINPSDEDFAAIEISCTPIDGDSAQPIVISGKSLEQRNYTISNLENDTEYSFTVKAIDTSNNISEGRIISSMPIASTIQLNVTLPNDENEITLTKDEAPIDIKILSSDKITKVVWKKNSGNVIVNAEDLLKDTFANQLSNNDSSRFFVSENGAYDIAVQNEEGVKVLQQVEVKTIDNTQPLPVKNLTAIYTGTCIEISWEEGISVNEYKSPLKNISVVYCYNNDENNTNNGSIVINPGIMKYSIQLPNESEGNDFIGIKVQTVDELDKVSECIETQVNCFFEISVDEITEVIGNLTSDSKVVVIGDWTDYSSSCFTELRNALQILYNQDSSILIDLDVTKIIGLRCIDFRNCKNIRTVKLPDTITNIISYQFSGCSALKKIIIPDGVSKIDQYAFQNCSELESIIFGNGLMAIDYKAFSGCSKINNIIIPSSVTIIYHYAFEGCNNLTSLDFESNYLKWRCAKTYINPHTVYSAGFSNNKMNNADIVTNSMVEYDFYRE